MDYKITIIAAKAILNCRPGFIGLLSQNGWMKKKAKIWF